MKMLWVSAETASPSRGGDTQIFAETAGGKRVVVWWSPRRGWHDMMDGSVDVARWILEMEEES